MFKYICNLIQMTWKMGLLKEQVNDLIFWNVNYVAQLIHDGHSLKKKKHNIKTKLSIPFQTHLLSTFQLLPYMIFY